MTDTPNLNLPYLLAAQSQKHVTHNEALRALDSVVQLAVIDRDLATPPSSPVEGDRYLVAASPTGEWAGQTGKIAAFQDGAWLFHAPNEGWLCWVADENALIAFDGAAWAAFSGGGGGVTDHGMLSGLGDDDHAQYHNDARGDARYTPINPSILGVNATADATNKFAVASAATLFNNTGNGHQIKINKAAAGDTASFLFQTAFSGRAELGTTGDDDFHFKVSANGSTWNEAIVVNRTTGAVQMPNTDPVTVQTFTSSGTWTKPSGCTRVRVRAVGGGGGGAGATAAASQCCAGSGGSGGSYSEGIFDVAATATVAVTTGAGGTGGAATNGAGGNGGSSSFGALLTAPGGVGAGGLTSGTSSYVGGDTAPGSVGSGGHINIAGMPGGRLYRLSGSVFGAGSGGASFLGGGARGNNAAAAGAAASANSGAGGAGAGSNSATGFGGGAGGDGIVIVEEFY